MSSIILTQFSCSCLNGQILRHDYLEGLIVSLSAIGAENLRRLVVWVASLSYDDADNARIWT